MKKKWYKNPLFIVIGVLIVVMLAATTGIMLAFNRVYVKNNVEAFTPDRTKESVAQKNGQDVEALPKQEREDKNILLFGVDKGDARTDTIMLFHIDGATSKMNVVSIPRDTRVKWTDEQIQAAKDLGRTYQNYSKLTDMSSLGGTLNLRQFTIRSIEEMLDIKIDNYVVVNLDVVKEIVDKIGGVEIDVPRKMEYGDGTYSVNLEPGVQTLNGEQAEGFIRWRHNNDFSEQYAMGDLGRVESQQLFVKATMDKVLHDISTPQLISLCISVYNNIKTDISLSDATDYITTYKDLLSIDNMTFSTLPGQAVHDDRWYFDVDETEIDAFIDKTFYGGM